MEPATCILNESRARGILLALICSAYINPVGKTYFSWPWHQVQSRARFMRNTDRAYLKRVQQFGRQESKLPPVVVYQIVCWHMPRKARSNCPHTEAVNPEKGRHESSIQIELPTATAIPYS